MTTATARKTPSAVLAQLTKERDEAHAEVREAMVLVEEYDRETEGLRAELTALMASRPTQFEGRNKVPRPGTEGEKLSAKIRKRQTEPNPHEADRAAKRTRFTELDLNLQRFRRQTLEARIAELDADSDEARGMLREGWERVVEGCELYAHQVQRVRDLVLEVDGMHGQHFGFDGEVLDTWRRLATGALERDVISPCLSPQGASRLGQIRQHND